MSHEIRTPMNGVLGMLDIVLVNKPPAEIKKKLLIAKHSADALLCIVNDILDLSKLDAGKVSFENITFDLKELLEDIHSLLLPSAQKKRIQLVLVSPTFEPHLSPEPKPHLLKGDPYRLRQIIINLVSNAIKFTSKGEVKIIVNTKQEASGVILSCKISDTGTGMGRDTLSHIFGSFTQADTSTTRKYGGTGLGLAITKMIIEQMNGQITVKSTPKIGSVFEFTVLLDREDCQENLGNENNSTENRIQRTGSLCNLSSPYNSLDHNNKVWATKTSIKYIITYSASANGIINISTDFCCRG